MKFPWPRKRKKGVPTDKDRLLLLQLEPRLLFSASPVEAPAEAPGEAPEPVAEHIVAADPASTLAEADSSHSTVNVCSPSAPPIQVPVTTGISSPVASENRAAIGVAGQEIPLVAAPSMASVESAEPAVGQAASEPASSQAGTDTSLSAESVSSVTVPSTQIHETGGTSNHHVRENIEAQEAVTPGTRSQESNSISEAPPVVVEDLNYLTSEDAQTVVDSIAKSGVVLWTQTGISSEQVQLLDSVTYKIGNLGGNRLGATDGSRITIDDNAAGAGWFVDPTPMDHSEFSQQGPATRHIDLLSIVLHEQGHVLGLDHGEFLMESVFDRGERSLPDLAHYSYSHADHVHETEYATLGTPPRVILPTVSGVQLQQLTSSNPASYDFYGYSAIDGDVAVVSLVADDDLGRNSGSVYIFRKDNAGTWIEEAQLFASDAHSFASDTYSGLLFGLSTGIANGQVLVGSVDGVYVFEQDSSGAWQEVQKLENIQGAESFGRRISVSGDNLLVAEGSSNVNVYERLNQEWILADSVTTGNSVESIDIDNGTIAIGSFVRDSETQLYSPGVVEIFTKNNTGNWTLIQSLVSPSSDILGFGSNVAIDGDFLSVTSRELDSPGVEIYRKEPGGKWQHEATLKGEDWGRSDIFNSHLPPSISIKENVVIVGAPAHEVDGAQNRGAAYVFLRSTDGKWSQQAKLIADNGVAGDELGQVVSFDGATIILSAPGVGDFEGSAYVFDLSESTQSYSIGDAPKLVLGGAVVADKDGANLTGAVVSLRNPVDGEAERLTVDRSAAALLGISVSYASNGHQVILQGSASRVAYEKLIRSVTYQNTSLDAQLVTREIAVAVSDQSGTSPIDSMLLKILPPDSDTLNVSVTEGENKVTDIEPNDAGMIDPNFSISGGADAGHFSIDPATGNLTFKLPPNFEDPNDQGKDNVYEVEVTLSGTLQTEVRRVKVFVNNSDDGPDARDDNFHFGSEIHDLVWGSVLVNDKGNQLWVSDVEGQKFVQGELKTISGRIGSLRVSSDGLFVYKPDNINSLLPGQTKTDTFDYTVTNSVGLSDSAVLNITISRDEGMGVHVVKGFREGGWETTTSVDSGDSGGDYTVGRSSTTFLGDGTIKNELRITAAYSSAYGARSRYRITQSEADFFDPSLYGEVLTVEAKVERISVGLGVWLEEGERAVAPGSLYPRLIQGGRSGNPFQPWAKWESEWTPDGWYSQEIRAGFLSGIDKSADAMPIGFGFGDDLNAIKRHKAGEKVFWIDRFYRNFVGEIRYDSHDGPAIGTKPLNVQLTTPDANRAVRLFRDSWVSKIEGSQQMNLLRFEIEGVVDGSNESIQYDGTTISLTDGESGTTGGGSRFDVRLEEGRLYVDITGAMESWDIRSDLNRMTYRHNGPNPSEGTRSIIIAMARDSGLGTGENENTSSFNYRSSVTIGEEIPPPVIVGSIADQVVLAGEDLLVRLDRTLVSSWSSNDTLIYAATMANGMALPSWLEFDDSTQTFRGSPSAGDVGTVGVRVMVTDPTGDGAFTIFQISVENAEADRGEQGETDGSGASGVTKTDPSQNVFEGSTGERAFNSAGRQISETPSSRAPSDSGEPLHQIDQDRSLLSGTGSPGILNEDLANSSIAQATADRLAEGTDVPLQLVEDALTDIGLRFNLFQLSELDFAFPDNREVPMSFVPFSQVNEVYLDRGNKDSGLVLHIKVSEDFEAQFVFFPSQPIGSRLNFQIDGKSVPLESVYEKLLNPAFESSDVAVGEYSD